MTYVDLKTHNSLIRRFLKTFQIRPWESHTGDKVSRPTNKETYDISLYTSLTHEHLKLLPGNIGFCHHCSKKWPGAWPGVNPFVEPMLINNELKHKGQILAKYFAG